jgi:hypothetical protein
MVSHLEGKADLAKKSACAKSGSEHDDLGCVEAYSLASVSEMNLLEVQDKK